MIDDSLIIWAILIEQALLLKLPILPPTFSIFLHNAQCIAYTGDHWLPKFYAQCSLPVRAHFEHKDLELMYGELWSKNDSNGILKSSSCMQHGGSVSMGSPMSRWDDLSSVNEGLVKEFSACLDWFAQSCLKSNTCQLDVGCCHGHILFLA